MRVAVIGAGIVGASAARWLATAGHGVVVFESRGPANPHGSSHGRSRIVRRAYPEEAFTQMMEEAYPMWRELEVAAEVRLLHEVGLLYFGAEGHPDILGVRQGLERMGVAHQVLGHKDAAHAVSGLRLKEGEIGVLTPEAGWVDPERAVHASLDLARRKGAEVQIEPAPSLDRLRMDFHQVVIAAGSWIRQWIDLPVQVTRQTFAYVPGRVEGAVWIEASAQNLYGFPSEGGSGSFKVGFHQAGPEASDDSREPVAEQVAAIRELARRRFGFGGTEIDAVGCVYTNTVDEGFLIGRQNPQVVYASACSGHGFKFGPWVGRKLATMVDEAE